MMEHSEKKIILPSALKPGDTLGIVAPAGSFEQMKLHRGISVLEQMGFKVYMPEGLFEKEDYLAGSDEHRAHLLNSLFKEEAVKAVICVRGGFGSLRILSLLDYRAIRKSQKIFIGFSDITALLSVFETKCGLISFHGPMVTTLADSDSKSRESESARVVTIGP